MPSYRPLAERFWEKVEKHPASECWPFRGSLDSCGYGRVRTERSAKIDGAHRVAWMLLRGEIPDGLEVCHRCDNPSCCNVEHMFLGTHKQNMDDMVSKRRVAHGPTHGFSKHPEAAKRGGFNRRGDANGMRKHPERCARGADHPSARLNEGQVREIRRRFDGGERNKAALAREFGVTDVSVSAIVSGKTWRHIAEDV